MKILIVEDDFPSRQLLKITLEREAYSPFVASNGKAGLELFIEHKPDIVISDVRMPEMDGLELLEKIRMISKDVIIVIITGHGNEELAIQSLKLGANNYIKKPIEIADLKAHIRRYYNIIKEKKINTNIPEFVVERNMSFEFCTDLNIVPAISKFLVKKIPNNVSYRDKVGIELGLSELIQNSMEHGNMGISFEMKSEALKNNNLQDLYNTKMSDISISQKKVRISFTYNSGNSEWIIEDEGNGFDWNKYTSVTNDVFSENLSGRGIYISRLQFDDMNYFDNGRKVVVSKINKND